MRYPCRAVLCLLCLAGGLARAADTVVPEGYQALGEAPAQQYDATLTVTGAGPVDVLFGLQDTTHGYRLLLGADRLELQRLGDPAVTLGTAALPPSTNGRTILLRRRDVTLYVVVDGRLVLDLLDSTYLAGQLAWKLIEGVEVKLPEEALQPAEDLYFTDDFMRTKDQQQLGVWRHLLGKWRFYSVLETNEKADVKLSVNPFSLGLDSTGAEASAVVTGQPFWCDYEYQASLRCRGGGWAGIIFGQRADDDYYLLRCDVSEQALLPRRIELVRVKGTAETVLSGGTALLSAEQWYRLGVRLRGPRVQCLLDSDVIFDRIDPECLGGPVGLWSRGDAETLFDDIRCVSNYNWPVERQQELDRNGRAVDGTWKQIAAPGDPIENDPGPRALVCGDPGGDYVWGDPSSAALRLDAKVKFNRPGVIRLLFGYQSPTDHYVVEWNTDENRLRLSRVLEGKQQLLGMVRGYLTPGREHTIALDLLTPNRVQVRSDGLLRMRAPLDELPRGRLGWGCRGTGATFSELKVRGYVEQDTEVEVDNSNFADDPFMLHWASSLADWFPVGAPANDANGQQVYWHKGDFYNAYHLELPVKGSVAVLLNATEEQWLPPSDATVLSTPVRIEEVENKQHPGDGYSLYVTGGGTPSGKLTLFRKGERVLDARLPENAETITVAHDGGVTWVQSGREDLLVYHDAQPLRGPRVALRVAGNEALYHVKCRREGIIDEVFDKAPAAWVQQGHWVITNRFSCTPTWSHMTALARGGLGALWHKLAFPGNVTVEYYAGMRMQSDYPMIYPRPGDLNCTFAAEKFNLDSGISLLPGAWDEHWSGVWTRYAQGLRTITETDRPLIPRTRENGGQRYIPVPYIAAGRDVHGAWYYLKSRYVEGQLYGYFDNVKVLEGEAPKVDGDRVAIWTQDDQIVIARVRITYQHKYVPKRLIDHDPTPARPHYAAPLVATVEGAQGLAFDFEDSLQGWRKTDRWQPMVLSLASVADHQALHVTSQLPGDTLEAVMPLGDKTAGEFESLPLSRASVLRFDYCIPAETKIDCYLTLNGRQYFVPLTGVKADSDILPRLIETSEIVADGQWHTARIALGAALKEQFGKTAVALTDLRFGQFHQGYLLAGFGGNPSGSWYALDNFAIVPEVAPGAPLKPLTTILPNKGEDAPSVKEVRAVVDRKPRTVPTEGLPGAVPTAPAEPGVAYLHVQGTLADGTLTATSHLPLLVSPAEPPLKRVDPNPAWGGGPVRLAFGDETPSDVGFTVLDKPLTWDQCVKVDATQRELLLDPTPAGLTFTDGQTVPMKVAVTFATGAKRELEFERVFSRGLDNTPPLPPTVIGAGPYWDLEDGKMPFTPVRPEQTLVRLDSDTPDGGGQAARIVNLRPGADLFTYLVADNLDLGRDPVLMVDYKIAEPVRSDFLVYTPSEAYALNFTDASGTYVPLATLPGVERDGKWHRATVNLQQAMASTLWYSPQMYSARRLAALDGGYSGGAPGASYQLDNLRLVAVTNGALKLSWQAYDPGGIAKYRYGVSEADDTAPETEVAGDQTGVDLKLGGSGLRWLALQACDGSGNWSRITRVPVLVDPTPPVFGTPTPAPGALGTWNLKLPVGGLDLAALDPASLRLTVGSKTVPVAEGDVVYDAAHHLLDWNWAWATKQFGGKVADGTALKVQLAGHDTAGNVAKPASWDYKVSYAADKQPPLAPDVDLPKQPLRQLETFTRGLGICGNLWSSYRSSRDRVLDTERHDHVLQVTTSGTGVALSSTQIDLAKYPFLSFDYKINSGAVLHLLVYLNGEYHAVALNGKSRSYKQLGRVPVAVDGKWHTAVIDLQAMAKTTYPNASSLRVRYIFMNEYGSSGGRNYWLDNVCVFGPVDKNLAATWACYDATGIQGVAAALSGDLAAGEPSQIADTDGRLSTTAAKPGTYLWQVRAQDGAGNWGGTARRVVVVQ